MSLFKMIFSWWNSATWGTMLTTWTHGAEVGKDQFGNRYYQNKDSSRRWGGHLRGRRLAIGGGLACEQQNREDCAYASEASGQDAAEEATLPAPSLNAAWKSIWPGNSLAKWINRCLEHRYTSCKG